MGDDYVLTSTGVQGAANAEANLKFDGNDLYVAGNITGSTLLVGGGSSIRPSVAFHPTYDAGFSSTEVQDRIDFQSNNDYTAYFDGDGMVIRTGKKFMVASSASFGRTTIGNKTVTVTGDISASGDYYGSRAFETGSIGGVGQHSGGDIAYFGTGTLTTGKMYYLRTNGAWDDTDASGTAAGSDELLGIALGATPGIHGVLLRGIVSVTGISNLTNPGRGCYMAEAANLITETAPTTSGAIVRIVGYVLHADDIVFFNPDNTWVEIA